VRYSFIFFYIRAESALLRVDRKVIQVNK